MEDGSVAKRVVKIGIYSNTEETKDCSNHFTIALVPHGSKKSLGDHPTMCEHSHQKKTYQMHKLDSEEEEVCVTT